MKKVNFKEFSVQTELEGIPVKMDIRKEIGNFIYQNSMDLGALELAKKIYFAEGETEIGKEEITMLLSLVEKSHITLPLRLALLKISTDE